MKVLRELTRDEKAEFERIGATNPALIKYLEASLETATQRLVSLQSESDFRLAQGQAQVLQRLLEIVTHGKR
jgi:hypothetical protein